MHYIANASWVVIKLMLSIFTEIANQLDSFIIYCEQDYHPSHCDCWKQWKVHCISKGQFLGIIYLLSFSWALRRNVAKYMNWLHNYVSFLYTYVSWIGCVHFPCQWSSIWNHFVELVNFYVAPLFNFTKISWKFL